jgi:hypothetical protein
MPLQGRLHPLSVLQHCASNFSEASADDHVLDLSVTLGVVPAKYEQAKLNHLDLTFAMGRGRQRDGVDLPAMEMQSKSFAPLLTRSHTHG